MLTRNLFHLWLLCICALMSASTSAAQTFQGTIAIGDTSVYSFEYLTGDRIIATLADAGDTDFTPNLELFAPDGTRLANITREDSASVNLTAETTGSYSIRVSDDANDTAGSFRLDVSRLSGSNDGGTLSNGASLTESLALGEVRAYQFSANAGDLVIATLNDALQSSSLRPRLEVYAPDGTRLSSTDGDDTAAAQLRVDQTGIFTLTASDDGYDVAGDLRLDLSVILGVSDGGTLNDGVTIADSLLRGEVFGFQFDAVAGDHLVATLNDTQLSGSFTPNLLVFAPNGDVLVDASNATTAWGNLPLEQSGTYNLLVADASFDAPGDFRLDFSLAQNSNDGGALSDGSSLNDNLLLGEVIFYRFDATAGQRIIVAMTDTEDDPSFSPRLELYAPDGNRLSRNSADLTASADLIASQTGTYSVMVGEDNYDFSGSFQLDLSVVAGPAPVVGGQAQEVIGSVTIDDTDSFSVQALAGDRLVVTLADNTNPGSSSSSVFLELFAPDGSALDSDSNISTAFINTAVSVSGTYSVVASEVGRDAAIDYRLDITRVRGANDGGTLANGTPIIDSLLLGEVLAYQFDAAAGDRIVATLADNSNPGSSASSAYLELYAPDGTRLTTDTSISTAIANLTVDQTGTFTFLVSESSYDSAMNFRLDFSRVPQVNDGGTLSNGVPVVDSLLFGEVLAYQFDAAAGDRIVATLADNSNPGSSASSAYLELYAPDGTRLMTSSSTDTADIDAFAGISGTFTLLVAEGSYDSAMDFRLDLVQTPASDGGTLTNGQSSRNTLLTGEVVLYHFEASAGDRVVISLSDVLNNFALSPRLQIAAPDGSFIVNETSSNAVAAGFIAPRTGTYLILVSENGFDSGYEYVVSLALGDDGFDELSLTSGMVITGPLVAGEVLTYRFTASAGDSIVATLTEGDLPIGASPRLQLFAPSGAAVDNPSSLSPSSTSLNHVHLTLNESGVYTLLASENGLDTSFNFRLEYARIPGTDDGGAIVNGTPRTGTLANGELIAFQFQASSGDTVSATLSETAATTSFAPFLELYDPTGTLLALDLDNTSATVNEALTSTGTYTLLVASLTGFSYGGSGDFSLSLSGATIPDQDDDGVPDLTDNCPSISNSVQQDTDGDSLGDACDSDDDNDGLTDSEESSIGTNPLLVDTDGDGFADSEEVDFETNPLDADSLPSINTGLPIWLLLEATRQ
ncbi:MAG: thrombospondin type 3 repeat-containing protein [Congregibacter sp.]